jgi:NTE family protein
MRIALALGSGGARGYVHIGVIRELEARGHEVAGVSGASMGAVVGALYSAGKLDDFEEWVRGLSQRDVLRLLDVSFAGGGAIRANKIMAVIGAMLDDIRIEDMQIPFTAVATDLRARREVWFTRGPADVAVRASFAIPSVITPALVGGRLVIDGGVTNPVPLEPLAPVESDLLLAVSLTGRRSSMRVSTFLESTDPDEVSSERDSRGSRRSGSGSSRTTGKLTGRIKTAAADVRDAELVRFFTARWGNDEVTEMGADAADDEWVPSPDVEEAVARGEEEVESNRGGGDSLPGTLRIFDVVIHSIEVMESIITAYRMAGNRPDVLIEVPSDSCTALDFHRADEMIALGRQLAADALDRAGV